MAASTEVVPVRVRDVLPGWGVTQERIDEAVTRIVVSCNPLRIVVFGSWARGDAGPDSDLDLAVFLDETSDVQASRHLHPTIWGIDMSVDILTFDEARHARLQSSPNSVHYHLAKEGRVLYERPA